MSGGGLDLHLAPYRGDGLLPAYSQRRELSLFLKALVKLNTFPLFNLQMPTLLRQLYLIWTQSVKSKKTKLHNTCITFPLLWLHVHAQPSDYLHGILLCFSGAPGCVARVRYHNFWDARVSTGSQTKGHGVSAVLKAHSCYGNPTAISIEKNKSVSKTNIGILLFQSVSYPNLYGGWQIGAIDASGKGNW